MAVERQQNWQPQQRVDIPHLRALESGVAGDMDVLVGQMLSGLNPFVVSGFDTIPPTAGTPATSVQINVANGRVCHPLASESGTIYSVPAGRTTETLNVSNVRVTGSFTASSTNYVGIDLLRSADDTTTDLLQILDSDTLLETPKEAPLARTLDYVIVISNQDFATTPNVAPLVKVVTDANNNVVSVEDARNLMFRLGKGGGVTNPLYTYPWSGGRTEAGNNTDFNTGDKVISSLKDWMDAAMTRLWEVGGGEHWYSATADRNVQMVRNGSTLFSSTGDYFEWTGTNLHWRELRFIFPNSTGLYNDVTDQLTDAPGAYGTTATDLVDGDCIYVDLDRTQNRTGGTALAAIKGKTLTLGSPAVPGSRFIIAWRVGSLIFTRGNSYSVGATFQVATTGALGVVKLHQASLTPAAPVVLSDGDLGTANGVVGFNANKQVIFTSASSTAVTVTGAGSGNGVIATGGPTNGSGVLGAGGGTIGTGVGGTGANNAGVGSGVGGSFQGGSNSGTTSETGTSGAGVVAQGPNIGGYGPAIVTKQSATSNIAAQIRSQDVNGNPRATVDYLGFRSGWVYEKIFFTDVPTINGGTSTTTLSVTSGTTANGRVGWSGPVGGGFLLGAWPGGAIYALCNNSRTNTDSAYFQLPAFYNTTNNATADPGGLFNQQVLVYEFVFAFEGSLSNVDFWIGLSGASAPTLPTASSSTMCAGIKFKQSAGGTFGGDTQLQLLTGDGTTQSQTSLGLTPALDTRYRVRLEIHRSGSPYGACVRCFVNGALTSKTTNLPITTSIGPDLPFQGITVSTGTVATATQLQFSPIRVNMFHADAGALTAGPTTSDV